MGSRKDQSLYGNQNITRKNIVKIVKAIQHCRGKATLKQIETYIFGSPLEDGDFFLRPYLQFSVDFLVEKGRFGLDGDFYFIPPLR